MWGDRLSVENVQPGAAGPAGPPGPAGVPYLQGTASAPISNGAVVKKIAGNTLATCTGAASGDGDAIVGVVSPAAAMGATANFYPDGSYAPFAGLTVGPVYRKADGSLSVWAGITVGEYTQQIGVSDGLGVHVRVGAEVQR